MLRFHHMFMFDFILLYETFSNLPFGIVAFPIAIQVVLRTQHITSFSLSNAF